MSKLALPFIWLFALVACGASDISIQPVNTTVQPVAPQETTANIRYHQIDNTTTIVIPDVRFPIVCTYVESVKVPEKTIYVSAKTQALPAVMTSGLGCVTLSKEDFDRFVELYP